MAIPFIGDIIKEVGDTVREFIPDADKRDEISFKLAELADKADARENELLLGNIEVNKIEASNANLFVAGWRPFIGWTCGAALAWTWIGAPFLKFGFDVFHQATVMPALPPESIYPIVLAMLGIGTMRTIEKAQGVATSVGGQVLVPQHKTGGPESQPAAVQASKRKWF